VTVAEDVRILGLRAIAAFLESPDVEHPVHP